MNNLPNNKDQLNNSNKFDIEELLSIQDLQQRLEMANVVLSQNQSHEYADPKTAGIDHLPIFSLNQKQLLDICEACGIKVKTRLNVGSPLFRESEISNSGVNNRLGVLQRLGLKKIDNSFVPDSKSPTIWLLNTSYEGSGQDSKKLASFCIVNF